MGYYKNVQIKATEHLERLTKLTAKSDRREVDEYMNFITKSLLNVCAVERTEHVHDAKQCKIIVHWLGGKGPTATYNIYRNTMFFIPLNWESEQAQLYAYGEIKKFCRNFNITLIVRNR